MFNQFNNFFFKRKNKKYLSFPSIVRKNQQILFCRGNSGNQKSTNPIRIRRENIIRSEPSPSIVILHIKATLNNTILTLTDSQGQVLSWVSAGSCGFKGARKGTPFAAKKVVEIFIKKSNYYLLRCQQMKIYVFGVGPGRENALRGFVDMTKPKQEKRKISPRTPTPRRRSKKFFNKNKRNKIILIREMTKIPHNGCRPPKKRRL